MISRPIEAGTQDALFAYLGHGARLICHAHQLIGWRRPHGDSAGLLPSDDPCIRGEAA